MSSAARNCTLDQMTGAVAVDTNEMCLRQPSDEGSVNDTQIPVEFARLCDSAVTQHVVAEQVIEGPEPTRSNADAGTACNRSKDTHLRAK